MFKCVSCSVSVFQCVNGILQFECARVFSVLVVSVSKCFSYSTCFGDVKRYYAVHGLFFRVKMVGRALRSVKILRPTDRSQNFGRTKLLSDSETVGRAKKIGQTKSIIDSSIFHMKERAVNRVAQCYTRM